MAAFIYLALQVTWFFVNLNAFFAGMDAWIGFGWFLALLVGLVLLYLGSWGSLAYSVIAFYGMTHVWDWHWFHAAIFAFPILVIIFFGGAATGIGSILANGAQIFRNKP